MQNTGKQQNTRRDARFVQRMLTFSRMISISEYFIPFTSIGISLKRKKKKDKETHYYSDEIISSLNQSLLWEKVSTYWTKWPERASLQMGCSASVSQNSQASRATFSSGSCVRWSIYWKKTQQQVIKKMRKRQPNIV